MAKSYKNFMPGNTILLCQKSTIRKQNCKFDFLFLPQKSPFHLRIYLQLNEIHKKVQK